MATGADGDRMRRRKVIASMVALGIPSRVPAQEHRRPRRIALAQMAGPLKALSASSEDGRRGCLPRLATPRQR